MPPHRATGNRLVIVIEGYCENPDLECNLDYWTYSITSTFPSRKDTQSEAAGHIMRGFPNDVPMKSWWVPLVKQVLEDTGR